MADLSKFLGKNIAVLGLGISGSAVVRELSKAGAKVHVWDDNEKSRQAIEDENLDNVIFEDLNNLQWDRIDALVMSAGIPLTHPKPHPTALLAQKYNCPIICDVELLFIQNSNAKFVGITGTNGKSTTTSLIGHILSSSSVKIQVGGNIGVAGVSLDDLDSDGCYVIEMSSYQLDLVDKTKFDIALLLNITPDHLDRHGDMEGYIKAKSNIFNNQQKGDIAVVNVDDENCKKIYDSTGFISNRDVVTISTKIKLDKGLSALNRTIYNNYFQPYSLLDVPDLDHLQGEHNMQNILASYAVAKEMEISDEQFIKSLNSFKGLKHRMQYLGSKNNIKFVNDSKATNAESASKALSSYKNIHWIVGGVAKDGGIESLAKYYQNVSHAYLIGQAQDEFAASLDGKLEYTKCEELNLATEKAIKAASNDNEDAVILLSPACASFDQWKSFEKRGDAFCDIVDRYLK